MAVTKLINSPIFHYKFRELFTGDNVSHYLPAKYLWHVCNVTKNGFYQPVYNFRLNETVSIDFMFFPQQPQHRYFKKPVWINQFVFAENTSVARKIAQNYDYFINNYRFRGKKNPPEVNWGYSPGLREINLFLCAYTYKAVYDSGLYIDDLELTDELQEFLNNLREKINPEGRPIIVIHHRGNDPWKRQLQDDKKNNEELLFSLLAEYPDSLIVIAGEPWRYYDHPRVRYLITHLNRKMIIKMLGQYSACLQYILAAFFCRAIEIVFAGVSGFTLFLESIRPAGLMPLMPVFWAKTVFAKTDPFIEKINKWQCLEYENYKKAYPEDIAFQYDNIYFMYYSRDEKLLQPYCFDYPNNTVKAFSLLAQLRQKYASKKQQGFDSIPMHIRPAPAQSLKETIVNILWKTNNRLSCEKQRILWLLRGVLKVVENKIESVKQYFRH
jgi:hypothetical protein